MRVALGYVNYAERFQIYHYLDPCQSQVGKPGGQGGCVWNSNVVYVTVGQVYSVYTSVADP